MTEDEISRFWIKVDKNGPIVRPELGNCWMWTASKRGGYGAFTVAKKVVQAHRASYELEYGEIAPLLRHKCDIRACVRPSHLEPGTVKDNNQDMLERNPRFATMNEAVEAARLLAAEGKSIPYTVEQVGVKRSVIVPAIKGATFTHIKAPPVQEFYHPIFTKLTEQQYEEILAALSQPYHGQGRKLAAEYGVHPSMITLIKKKRLKTIRGASQEL